MVRKRSQDRKYILAAIFIVIAALGYYAFTQSSGANVAGQAIAITTNTFTDTFENGNLNGWLKFGKTMPSAVQSSTDPISSAISGTYSAYIRGTYRGTDGTMYQDFTLQPGNWTLTFTVKSSVGNARYDYNQIVLYKGTSTRLKQWYTGDSSLVTGTSVKYGNTQTYTYSFSVATAGNYRLYLRSHNGGWQASMLVDDVKLEKAVPTVTCTDSDNGKNYDVKGSATSVKCVDQSNCKTATVIDICGKDANVGGTPQTSNSLQEFFCYDGYSYVDFYECPYGCLDGACMQPRQTPPFTIATGDNSLDYDIAWSMISSLRNSRYAVSNDMIKKITDVNGLDLDNKVTLAIYNGKIKVIVGANSPPQHIIFATDIVTTYQYRYGKNTSDCPGETTCIVNMPAETVILSTDVHSANLIDLFAPQTPTNAAQWFESTNICVAPGMTAFRSGKHAKLTFMNYDNKEVELDWYVDMGNKIRFATGDYLISDRIYLQGDICTGTISVEDCEGARFLAVTPDKVAHVIEITNVDTINNKLDFKDLTYFGADKDNAYGAGVSSLSLAGFGTISLNVDETAKSITFVNIAYSDIYTNTAKVLKVYDPQATEGVLFEVNNVAVKGVSDSANSEMDLYYSMS